MEPVTIALVTTAFSLVAATHRPKWEDNFREEKSSNVVIVPKREITAIPLVDRRANNLASNAGINSPKEKLYQKLMSFFPKGDEDPAIEPVSKIEDVIATNELLQKLPGSVSLPTVMRNDEGEIGMYWDNDHMYISIDVDSSSTVSVYFRDQTTGQHSFNDEVQISEVNAAWFEANIGKMLEPGAVIA
ncbi:hypothetical protein ACHAC9_22150 [Massilia sp. CMS3.1]|uniref:hypothetical protein n=1 Tax=Massilia sp. CMS3.1 TaxID=3373083 RepID=UPI003EE57644